MFIFVYGAKVEERVWKDGKNFIDYLKEHNISIDIISSLDIEEMQLISEIEGDREFCEPNWLVTRSFTSSTNSQLEKSWNYIFFRTREDIN